MIDWGVNEWKKKDSDYFPVYRKTWSASDCNLWIVLARHADEYRVVRGPEGKCGEEPVVAGPFATWDEANAVATFLHRIKPGWDYLRP